MGQSNTYSDLRVFGEITAGKLTVYGKYSFPDSDGMANQILVTDGSGNISFQDASSVALTPPSIIDGTGLTWTAVSPTTIRGDVSLAPFTTDDLGEGMTNLYYQDEYVDDRVNALLIEGTGITKAYNDSLNTLTLGVNLAPFSTSNLTEGTRLYYTDLRVENRMAAVLDKGVRGTGSDAISWTHVVGTHKIFPTVSLTPFSTDDLSEGTTNLYLTENSLYDLMDGIIQDSASVTWTRDNLTNKLTAISAASSIEVQHDGVSVATNPTIDFITSPSITYIINDDIVNAKTTIQIDAANDAVVVLGGGTGSSVRRDNLNTASGDYSTVSGGEGNSVTGDYSTVAGGTCNSITSIGSFVGGGANHNVSGDGVPITISISSTGPFPSAVDGVYYPVTSTSGLGTGTKLFVVIVSNNVVSWETIARGVNYKVGDTITIDGADVGGISGVDDITFMVDEVVDGGSTVSGGFNNDIFGVMSSIGGGINNIICGHASTIAAGTGNIIDGVCDFSDFSLNSAIGGGETNSIFGDYHSIGGGGSNTISSLSGSTIAGGASNTIAISSPTLNHIGYSIIAGGVQNTVLSYTSVISGGNQNMIDSCSGNAVISGGCENYASQEFSTISGGGRNYATGNASTVSGGYNNLACGTCSTVSGGCSNSAYGDLSIVLGGKTNFASGCFSIVGGHGNTASGDNSNVIGGCGNSASGCYSTVLGGFANNVGTCYSSILGGGGNTVNHCYASAIGCNITSVSERTFHVNYLNLYSAPLNDTGNTSFLVRGSDGMINYRTYGGLFAQTGNSSTVTNTVTETSIVDSGVGTLTVPANGFHVGDSFNARMGGVVSSANGHTLTIRIKSETAVLATTGAITMPNLTNKEWNLDIQFTTRAVGVSGTMHASGWFSYNSESNHVGLNFNTLTSPFNTTASNTLNITATWGTASESDAIYSTDFTLHKIF